jgi:hypothetical protein
MRLLLDVLAYLEARGVPAALIVGSALATHGVARATLDSDVLVVDAAALRHDFWAMLKLYAAGPQDLVDVQLLLAGDPEGLSKEVEQRLQAVPAGVRAAWRRVREQSTA